MNIFVLNTGRCGSTTFIKACEHITNYSAAHESRSSMLGNDRFTYPSNHIEADNRLSWLLGRLDRKYGDSALYVHLKRNDTDTARSFTKRYKSGIIAAYRGKGILTGLSENADPMSVSLDYCDTVNSNIELFLKDKTNKITVTLEDIQNDFQKFWLWLGAEGDLTAALNEFKTSYNATPKLQDALKKQPTKTQSILRLRDKAARLVAKLPEFVRNA